MLRRSVRCLGGLSNRAFVFVKPHANTPKVREEVLRVMGERSIGVVSSGTVQSADLRDGKLVDRHYSSISCAAMMPPCELAELISRVPSSLDQFTKRFGQTPKEAAAADRLLNVPLALRSIGLPTEILKSQFNAACWKLASGIYVAELEGKIIINGFYGRLREKFTADGASISWFLVEFDAAQLSFTSFRDDVVGATDPILANTQSLRGRILRCGLRDWGMGSPPDKQDNGFHASASPLEAMDEQITWLSSTSSEVLANDPLGKALVQRFGQSAAEALLQNPPLQLADGRQGTAFDLVEGADAENIVQLLGQCTGFPH
eukprot:TRINITY_DN33955_c0_g1_i1.p1 TRINITY_DN33955_c0_g1~~TRINITY_DN33955_c0_g1_i1.p1  ORF type:complete len:318 (-),score=56.78 TRINITY_DN33955_c0_g1_i1:198-1151(-)